MRLRSACTHYNYCIEILCAILYLYAYRLCVFAKLAQVDYPNFNDVSPLLTQYKMFEITVHVYEIL